MFGIIICMVWTAYKMVKRYGHCVQHVCTASVHSWAVLLVAIELHSREPEFGFSSLESEQIPGQQIFPIHPGDVVQVDQGNDLLNSALRHITAVRSLKVSKLKKFLRVSSLAIKSSGSSSTSILGTPNLTEPLWSKVAGCMPGKSDCSLLLESSSQ